jgi:hypothetical protein
MANEPLGFEGWKVVELITLLSKIISFLQLYYFFCVS